jgi:hypothetical protein
MKIIDINGKEREVLSVKIITQQIQDAVNGGIATTKEYVEVVIKGKTGRVWKEWYPVEDFKRLNPTVKV